VGDDIMKKEWATPVIAKLSFENTEGGIFLFVVEGFMSYKTGS